MKKRWLLPVLILAVCILAGFCAGLAIGAEQKTQENRQEEETPALLRTAVTCGDWSLNATELGYYYWSEYFYYINTSASPQPDTAVPLDEQEYSDGETWQDYFLSLALDKVKSTMTLVFAGQESGYTLDGDYAEDYETVQTRFEEYASAAGYVTEDGESDLDAYLRASYGEYADKESFFAYLEDAYYAAGYAETLMQAISPSDTEVQAYYEAHQQDYEAAWDEQEPVTVRTITLTGEDAAARAATLYEQWQGAGSTEDGFAQLAQEYSKDDAAEVGGLQENLAYPNADSLLQQWCFEDSRAAGDSTVLDGDAESILVLFLSRAEHTRAYTESYEDLRYEQYRNQYETLAENYQFYADTENLVLAVPEGLYDEESETE